MYSAKILADSFNLEAETRLTTFEITYPRFVHSELLTHRMFSRNSASSRAIPNEKLRQRIIDNPVFPVWWGKNQSGMQANEELDPEKIKEVESIWITARDHMLAFSEQLGNLGVHKQICNRLLEPWMYITVIVTATEYENYYYLRTSQLPTGQNKVLDKRKFDPNFPAQPEIQKIARLMWELQQESEPYKARHGDWHLPLVTETERATLTLDQCIKLSVGRCARVSYLTHDGKRDLEADFKLHDRLEKSGHWSPFEHQAKALALPERNGNFIGWEQYRKTFRQENYGKHLR